MEQVIVGIILLFPLGLQALGARNRDTYMGLLPLFGGAWAFLATLWVVATGQPVSFSVSALLLAEALLPSFISLHLDTLSGILTTTVLIIGAVVMRYSVRYLEDDQRLNSFLWNMASVLTCVLLMLLSRNLGLLIAAWAGASFFLHTLLLHFPNREKARKAAEQKFWISRLGDVLLIVGTFILFRLFQTLDLPAIFELASGSAYATSTPLSLQVALCLLSVGVLVKSAQYPFHFWLPKSIETPTPVSALLHAGIINAGGYLLIRLSPLLVKVDAALVLILIVGTITTIFGALVMLVQTDVKKQLAYSTVTQMGFMMVQCGVGAFFLASLHIVGHAFYKAYAFLNSGTAADMGRLRKLSPLIRTNQADNLWPQMLALVSALACFSILLWLTEIDPLAKPGGAVLSLVLILAMAQTLLSSKKKSLSLGFAISIGAGYLFFYYIWSALLEQTVRAVSFPLSPVHQGVLGISAVTFLALYLAQNNLGRFFATPMGSRLYVYLLNGGYLGR